MTDTDSRTIRNPAGATVLVLVLAVLALWAMRTATLAGAESAKGERLVDSPAFQSWTALAALALVVFGKVLLDGVRELGRPPLRDSTPPPRVLALWCLAFTGIVFAVLKAGGRGGPDVPLENWTQIVWVLLGWGGLAAAPWVIAVWAAHSLLHDTEDRLEDLTPVSAEGRAEVNTRLHELRRFRAVIVRAVTRLLVLVLAATLMSGALRTALVPKFIKEEVLPTTGVLLYGAFFTGVLATAVVPLMLRWRSLARSLVERAYPYDVDDTSDETDARERLLEALGVNGSLFTFPVTLSALLAPLVTSLLAVYIPELGK